MMNVLRSELYKLYRARIFWILLAIAGTFSLFITVLLFLEEKGLLMEQVTIEVEGDQALEGFNVLLDSLMQPDTFFTYLSAAVLSSFFITSEYTNGAIKNIVSVGHKRRSIYAAKFLTTWFGTIYLYVFMVGTFFFFTSIFFEIGPFPDRQEWVDALIAFGLTCLLIGVFCAIIAFFSIVMRSAAVALFATVGFYFVFSTALNMLASQYTFFDDILEYSVFEYMSLMSVDSVHDGSFISSLILVTLATFILFTGVGMLLFERKDIQ